MESRFRGPEGHEMSSWPSESHWRHVGHHRHMVVARVAISTWVVALGFEALVSGGDAALRVAVGVELDS